MSDPVHFCTCWNPGNIATCLAYLGRVTTACVTFLELCGLDSQEIRVDVEAAKRIYRFKLKEKQYILDVSISLKSVRKIPPQDEDPKLLREIIELFLSFENDEEKIQNALIMLENATKTYTATNGVSKWLLVTQFCAVHHLPLSSGHLRELAGPYLHHLSDIIRKE